MKTSTRPSRRVVAATILLGCWCLPRSAGAQVNTERMRVDRDTVGWSGAAEARGTLRTGAVSLVVVRLGGRLDVQGTRTLTFFVGSGDFGWEGGERFSNQALFHLRHQRTVAPGVTPEVFAQFNYNKSRLLDGRALLGGGGRFDLLARPRVHVVVGTGYMLEREWYDLPASAAHPRRQTAHRWNNYVTGNFSPSEPVRLVVTTYVQPRWDRFSDVRVLTDARLGVTLTGTVALTLTWNARYDSRPPDDLVTLDTTLEAGVAVEW